MVKAYAIENLEAGMKIGRDVLTDKGELLLPAGSVLTQENICGLLERPIFFIYIEEEEKAVNAPSREHILDEDYVECYERTHEKLRTVMLLLAQESRMNWTALKSIVWIISEDLATDGAKAISQIHNMERSGEYLFHHSLHVGILAALMGKWLGWDQERREELIAAGLLHDIGKLSIDKAILDKAAPLTKEEFEQIKRHTEFGMAMLKNAMEQREGVLLGALQHHERCDGSGYPAGLKKEEISEFGRIIAFLDIYDAMASDRVFASKVSPFEAFAVMEDDLMAGKLDPEFAVLFMRQTCRALVGTWVELSNGVRGSIVYIPESRIVAMPMVRTMQDEFIDLESRRDLKIKSILTAAELGM